MTKSKKRLEMLMDELKSVEGTKDMIAEISSYKKELNEISKDKLNDSQKIWLLACEGSEAKMPQIIQNDPNQLTEDIALLYSLIPEDKDY